MELQTLQEQFAPFRNHLHDLHDRIASGEEFNALPGHTGVFLEEEAYVDYFTLPEDMALPDDMDNKKYIGMLFRPDTELQGEDVTPLPVQVESKARIMAGALGHAGLEQIVAYSTDSLAIVAEDPNGTRLDEMHGDTLAYLPLPTYARLFDTFRTMEGLGLTIDSEYYMSIALPEINPDAPLHVPDFIVTRYRKSSGQTFMDHVLGLGLEITGVSDPTQPITSEAVRYYLAIDRHLGKEKGLEMIHAWLRRGYAIPSIDYNTDDAE